MKNLCFALLLLVQTIANASDVASLKAFIEGGKTATVSGEMLIEGIVASDYRSLNTALNPNKTYAVVDNTINGKTVYIQDPDGNCGAEMVFVNESDNRLCRGDRVVIDLNGCSVTHFTDPDRVQVNGLTFLNVVSCERPDKDGLTPKERKLSELDDSDLYTLVRLNNVEMIFKDGPYTDIYEGYAQAVDGYNYEGFYPNMRMDGWATLLRDGEGKTIYMHINTACKWRRDGKPVPQGTGSVTGVLVYEPMRRYGGNMGRYSIRPMDDSDISLSKKNNSEWKVLTGWEQDGSNGETLEFELMGTVDGLFKNGKKGDRVLNDCGKARGYLWTDSNSAIHVHYDLNDLSPSNRGNHKYGAILFSGNTADWFLYDGKGKAKESRSIFVEFDASKAKGNMMEFNFSWFAGTSDVDLCYNYPGVWKVQMTVDEGRTWVDLKETATGSGEILLRSHPWFDKAPSLIKSKKNTGFDCGLGAQQRSFSIPESAFGHNQVILRLTPARPELAAVRTNPSRDVMGPPSAPSREMKNLTWIRFGKILIEYK